MGMPITDSYPDHAWGKPRPGTPQAMKVLVIASETIDADALRSALPGDLDPADTEVMVVAPALHESPLKFWMSDADDAIARSEEVRRQTLTNLADAGVPAAARRGESDPEDAIRDALQTFPAEHILVFTHNGEGQHYREDIDAAELEERFGIPVRRVGLSG